MDDLQRIKKLAGIVVNENGEKNDNSPDDEEHVPENPAEYAEQSADLDAEAYGKKFEEDLEEGSGPTEKQHSQHVDRNSPAHIAAVARQKGEMAAAAAAKPGKELLDKIKNKGLEEGLDNGYKTREVCGSDFFPDGADSPVVDKVGPSGAKQGDNPEQKRMMVAELHKDLVYKYRKFLNESNK